MRKRYLKLGIEPSSELGNTQGTQSFGNLGLSISENPNGHWEASPHHLPQYP